MPQVDLSSIYSGGVLPDRKVSCETLAGAGTDHPIPAEDHPSTSPLDYAPESFWLSKDTELDWLDRNAFIERKDSGKGFTNPNPNNNNISNGVPSKSSSIPGSQRYSIIGLPKPQKTNYAEAKNRRTCRPTSIRLFPKRSEPVRGKPANIALCEPASPKVSCMGRVRSRKKQTEPGLASRSIERKTGFWRNFRFVFGSKGDKIGCKGNKGVVEPVALKKKRGPRDRKPNPIEPPDLVAMNRFVSGRRSDGWAAELEVNEEKCEPLDHDVILQRRKRGQPGDVDVVDRDVQSVGPSSV